jgi:acyl-CoA thioesterase
MNEPVNAQAETMWQADRASRGLGMHLDEVAPGRARLSMTITEAMTNGHGICHGGFIFSLADSAVAQHAAITFIRPGRVGETLVAEAVERMRAGRSGMCDVRVSTAAGDLVAEFRGHTRMLRGTTQTEATDGGT